jgi:hypothetical protein
MSAAVYFIPANTFSNSKLNSPAGEDLQFSPLRQGFLIPMVADCGRISV